MTFTAILVASTVAMVAPHAAPKADHLPRFTVAAVNYWGNGHLPACGPISYAWAKAAAPDEKAHADLASCTVVVNADYWPQFTANPGWECVLVAHEVGHLYGHQHSEGGIMANDGDAGTAKYANWREFAPCAQAVPA